MPQEVILRRRVVVGTMLVGVVGCTSGLSTLAPVGFVPTNRETVREWVGELAIRQPRLYEIRPWRYRNERGSAAGRASIRVSPPDSMRFDYRGPFGRSGNAVVVGDSALWVTSDDGFEGLFTYAPLFWAALGLPQMPADSAPLYGLVRDDVRAWRYILAGDTLDFVLRGTPARRLEGEMRRQGQILGQVRVDLDSLTGLAVQSQLDFWDVSRFELTVRSVDTLARFDATIWQRQ